MYIYEHIPQPHASATLSALRTHLCMHVHVHVHAICACACCVHARTCACACTYMCMCMHAYIPLSAGSNSTVAVVGSSGNLLGSRWGKVIDTHDVIIRVNGGARQSIYMHSPCCHSSPQLSHTCQPKWAHQLHCSPHTRAILHTYMRHAYTCIHLSGSTDGRV